MKRIVLLHQSLVAACALLFASLALQAQELSPLEKINAASQSGAITEPQRILYQTMAIRAPDRLSPELQSTQKVTPRDFRCATPYLLEAARFAVSADEPLKTQLLELMSRPTRAVSYDSPAGNFRLHYDTSGTHAVSLIDSDSSGVPDFIELLAEIADSSWHTNIDLSGYYEPPSDDTVGGDSRYDIYFENISFFGFVQSTDPGPESWNDYQSYMVLHNSFEGFPPNDDPDGDAIGSAKATIAHEFFHSIQLSYDVGDELWFMESSATWNEEIVFDATNDNYQFLPDFFGSPHTMLTANTSHFYSTFVFPLYLSQTLDTLFMRRVWEGARYKNAFDVLADTLPVVYGITRDSAFSEFITWVSRTGVRADGQGFEEAAGYPDISLATTVDTYPVLGMNTPQSPGGYASSTVRFQPGVESGDLKLTFDGFNGRMWVGYLITTNGANSHTIRQYKLDALNRGTLKIENFEQYSDIRLVGANLSAYTSAAPYNFSAEVISGPSVGVSPEGDTIAYTLAANKIAIRVENYGATVDSFTLGATDNAGWTLDGPAGSFALAPGQDTLLVFTVTPPSGTLPGALSLVSLIAQSLTNPQVVDSVTHKQLVSIRFADANWDGKINIADVTYLIAFLFNGGSAAMPFPEAGDATCDGKVNIADVTYIISYLFSGALEPSCNTLDSF